MSAVGTAIGEVARWLDGPGRRRAEQHLATALPHLSRSKRQRVARLTFRHRGRARALERSLLRLSDVEICRRWSLDGWERFNEAAESGRGAIAVVLPLGLEDLVPRALHLYRSAYVVEPSGRGLLRATERLAARGTVATGLLPVSGLSRPLLAPFFEDRVPLSDLPARLALETGAATLPVHALGSPHGVRLHVGEPIASRGTVEEITSELAARAELTVGASPELWPWERELG